MMAWKKFSIMTLCLVFLVTSLAACSKSKSGDQPPTETKPVVLKLGHIRPTGSVADNDVVKFVENVTRKTNGQIKIEVYPASQLGDYTVVQERVSIGDVDMQIAPLATTLDKAFGISNAPYIVENWEQARRVFASGSQLIKAMESRLNDNGIKLLGIYPLYFGGIALTKEPKAPNDATVPKGIKIRVPPMKSFEKCAESLGYIATPIPWADTFTSLQTGIVEGAIGAGAEGYYSNFKDLVKYYLPLNDHFEMWYLYINKDLWNKLPSDQQTALQEAAKELEEKRFQEAEGQTKEFEAKLEEAGATIIKFNNDDLKAFAKKARQETWPVIKGDYGAELFDSITKGLE